MPTSVAAEALPNHSPQCADGNRSAAFLPKLTLSSGPMNHPSIAISLCAVLLGAAVVPTAWAHRPAPDAAEPSATRSSTSSASPIPQGTSQAASQVANLVAPPTARFCSNRSLRGTYLWSEGGQWAEEPTLATGMDTYDGVGGVKGIATDSDSGEPFEYTGTYEIAGNCRGRLVFDGGFAYDIYVSPDGSTANIIATDFGAVISGSMQRVSTQMIVR